MSWNDEVIPGRKGGRLTRGSDVRGLSQHNLLIWTILYLISSGWQEGPLSRHAFLSFPRPPKIKQILYSCFFKYIAFNLGENLDGTSKFLSESIVAIVASPNLLSCKACLLLGSTSVAALIDGLHRLFEWESIPSGDY